MRSIRFCGFLSVSSWSGFSPTSLATQQSRGSGFYSGTVLHSFGGIRHGLYSLPVPGMQARDPKISFSPGISFSLINGFPCTHDPCKALVPATPVVPEAQVSWFSPLHGSYHLHPAQLFCLPGRCPSSLPTLSYPCYLGITLTMLDTQITSSMLASLESRARFQK